jgi:hypothetical protein
MNFEFDIEFFDKFLFHNCKPQLMHTDYFNNAFNYTEELNFENDKINIWYVRDDKGCNDYVYNDDLESMQKTIPNEIVSKVNNGSLLLVLSTESEWQYDDFWKKIIKYCKSVGIDKTKIHIMNSNVKTSLSNSHTFTFSSLPCPKYDLGITWLDKYPDIFPYTDEVVNDLSNRKRQKRYICLNAHYQEHRHFTVYKLFEKKLNNLGYISFTLGQGMNYTDMPKDRMIFEWDRFISGQDFDIKDKQDSVDFVDKLPIFLKEFGNDEPQKYWDDYYHFTNEKYRKYTPAIRPWMVRDFDLVKDTYFCISTETLRESDNGNMCNFSEKVMLGWILQPTIIVGTSGIIKHLKSLGLESYNELFDESYDDVVETNKRLVKVMNEVERVCKMPEDELRSIYSDILPKVIHNQHKIFEYSVMEDWKNILTELSIND